jgi:hypothetical protein
MAGAVGFLRIENEVLQQPWKACGRDNSKGRVELADKRWGERHLALLFVVANRYLSECAAGYQAPRQAAAAACG